MQAVRIGVDSRTTTCTSSQGGLSSNFAVAFGVSSLPSALHFCSECTCSWLRLQIYWFRITDWVQILEPFVKEVTRHPSVERPVFKCSVYYAQLGPMEQWLTPNILYNPYRTRPHQTLWRIARKLWDLGRNSANCILYLKIGNHCLLVSPSFIFKAGSTNVMDRYPSQRNRLQKVWRVSRDTLLSIRFQKNVLRFAVTLHSQDSTM